MRTTATQHISSTQPLRALDVYSTDRLLAVCKFENEYSPRPKFLTYIPWSRVIQIHERRYIRDEKSGPLIGAYELRDTRKNENVLYRSLIQLDIDTDVKKDKNTGRILEVTKKAPAIDEMRKAIDRYEWIATSSHSHQPDKGIEKYHITLRPDRDIRRDEHEPVLEALDELLMGALDRGAWQWAQAFYLPSCPEDNEHLAFFEHNTGDPVPVDALVQRGRQIIKNREGTKPHFSERAAPSTIEASHSTSSAHKIVKSCPTLAYFAAERGAVSEPLWRTAIGTIKHTMEGETLCHEWSKGDPRYNREETQRKIDGWVTGPALCKTFAKIADAKCHECDQNCRSPIRLGYPEASNYDDNLYEFNLRYFVAKIGGSVYVFDTEEKDLLSTGMSFTAFGQFHAGNKFAKEWLKSTQRRTYDALIFDPSSRNDRNSFNTWKGLTVSPRMGSCKKILKHIRHVWCGGDRDQYKYVLRWLALLVQKPWIKPEVALVLRSREGTGKTIIVEMLLKIFGMHGFTTAQKEQVAGRFNGHLFDKVLVVLEEAFFAGDPAAVAATKALVTNATLGYEAKGKDAISAPNYAHVITITNHDWAVPAGGDARRWMVLDVSDRRKGDHAYFEVLAHEIDNGGTEAFLAYLLALDLSGWNPRVLPESVGLKEQQVQTMQRSDPVAAWVLNALSEGAFVTKDGSLEWAEEISSSDLQESYVAATARSRYAPPFHVAAKRLRGLLPPGSLTKLRKGGHTSRYFSYQLPDLDQARRYFKEITGVDPCAT